MKRLNVFIVLCLMVLAVSCSTDRWQISDSEADLSTLRTYDWATTRKGEEKSRLNITIRSAVNRELEAKGFRMTSDNPDFLTTAWVKREERRGVTDRNVDYGRSGWSWVSSGVDRNGNQKGTLILDFLDPESRQPIWRGSARANLLPNTASNEQEREIDRTVQDIFEDFPPVLSE